MNSTAKGSRHFMVFQFVFEKLKTALTVVAAAATKTGTHKDEQKTILI
jgi:hypothetical protein